MIGSIKRLKTKDDHADPNQLMFTMGRGERIRRRENPRILVIVESCWMNCRQKKSKQNICTYSTRAVEYGVDWEGRETDHDGRRVEYLDSIRQNTALQDRTQNRALVRTLRVCSRKRYRRGAYQAVSHELYITLRTIISFRPSV